MNFGRAFELNLKKVFYFEILDPLTDADLADIAYHTSVLQQPSQ